MLAKLSLFIVDKKVTMMCSLPSLSPHGGGCVGCILVKRHRENYKKVKSMVGNYSLAKYTL